MAYAQGYDVSDFQSGIPDDADFVFIKASEGGRTEQSGYAAKVADARGRGLVVGHYHFLHAENPVEGEIEHFCRVVGQVPAGELLALDFEPYGQGVDDASATDVKNRWLAAVKSRYPDNRVGLYVNRDYWFRTDDDCGDFLWIADYVQPGSPRIQAAWKFHQYGEDPLDSDVYNGSAADLRDWAGAPAPRPEPTPQPSPAPARYRTSVGGLPYGYGVHGDQVTAVGRALVAAGFGRHYQQGPGPDWSDADTLNYADFQSSLGYSGSDADGVPGETSLRELLGGPIPLAQVDHGHVVASARHDPSAPQGATTYPDDVYTVQLALVAEGLLDPQWGHGSFGTRTIAAYSALQSRYGYSGQQADGIPGVQSLTRLGEAHGFTVVD
ncbi:peptidoglycan-binding protein [Kitasatospora sp. NPDC056783]|uniref:peptidoglycan-binding protein n=1 Tax=Kitasatospora sp. NPDC056783 TaxID=3345943 RepID=UPI0036C7B0F8